MDLDVIVNGCGISGIEALGQESVHLVLSDIRWCLTLFAVAGQALLQQSAWVVVLLGLKRKLNFAKLRNRELPK